MFLLIISIMFIGLLCPSSSLLDRDTDSQENIILNEGQIQDFPGQGGWALTYYFAKFS